jgi:hypothetical protein
MKLTHFTFLSFREHLKILIRGILITLQSSTEFDLKFEVQHFELN